MSQPNDGTGGGRTYVTYVASAEAPGGGERVRVWVCEHSSPDRMFLFTGPRPVVTPADAMTQDEAQAWLAGLAADGFKYRVIAPEALPKVSFDSHIADAPPPAADEVLLTFRVHVETPGPVVGPDGLLGYHGLTTRVNATAWKGRPPGSCVVRSVRDVRMVPVNERVGVAHTELEIVVGYRPRGWADWRGSEPLPAEFNDFDFGTLLVDGMGRPDPPG